MDVRIETFHSFASIQKNINIKWIYSQMFCNINNDKNIWLFCIFSVFMFTGDSLLPEKSNETFYITQMQHVPPTCHHMEFENIVPRNYSIQGGYSNRDIFIYLKLIFATTILKWTSCLQTYCHIKPTRDWDPYKSWNIIRTHWFCLHPRNVTCDQ